MDELKEKLLKKISLFGRASGSGKFRGKANVLGSAPAQANPQPPRSRPLPSATSGLPKLIVPQAPLAPPPAAPTSLAAAAADQQQTMQVQYAQQARAAAAAVPSSDGSSAQASTWQQQQQQQELDGAQEAASEAVSMAVGQLASDPASAAAAELLCRLLGNIVGAPGEQKYRRVRLSNPRIQAAVVDVSGGVELLLACGFQILFEEAPAAAAPDGNVGALNAASAATVTEGYAVLADDADLAPLQLALQLLPALLPAPSRSSMPATAGSPPAPAQQAAGGNARSSSGPSAQLPSPQQQQQQQQPARQQRPVKPREWDPPRERNTEVLLPTSVESDVPEWFFQRTGQELKAAFMAATRQRQQDQVLMTRAMRERLQGAGSRPVVKHATIKVRFPEGISLQGEFSAGEPLAAVFAWVADCLSDPLHTYELVLPTRQPLAPEAKTVREASLLPSIVLLFRWTGQSATDMRHVPALRHQLLQAARPATVSY